MKSPMFESPDGTRIVMNEVAAVTPVAPRASGTLITDPEKLPEGLVGPGIQMEPGFGFEVTLKSGRRILVSSAEEEEAADAHYRLCNAVFQLN